MRRHEMLEKRNAFQDIQITEKNGEFLWEIRVDGKVVDRCRPGEGFQSKEEARKDAKEHM